MSDVLLIDDDADSSNILETLFKTLHLASDRAETATQALQLLQSPSASYRLILSDLALPGNQDGLELIRTIRNDPRFQTTPCIAITAFDFPHIRTQALQAGFTAYYIKPIDLPALLRDLKNYLG